jgi:CRISPR/Cas system-associated exonuclease Cas4 (RecB family)
MAALQARRPRYPWQLHCCGGGLEDGKRRPDFDQLEMFALAVFSFWPSITKVSSMFVWTKENAIDKEMYRVEHKDEMWTRLMTRIHRVEKSLETDNWPAKPSGLCKFCPCKGFCEFAS